MVFNKYDPWNGLFNASPDKIYGALISDKIYGALISVVLSVEKDLVKIQNHITSVRLSVR